MQDHLCVLDIVADIQVADIQGEGLSTKHMKSSQQRGERNDHERRQDNLCVLDMTLRDICVLDMTLRDVCQ